jgi:hypothetical protein
MTKRIICMLMGAVVLALVGGTVLCHAQDDSKPVNDSHKAYVVAPSYDYELSGRTDRVPDIFRHRLRAPSSTEGRKESINKEDTSVVCEPRRPCSAMQ